MTAGIQLSMDKRRNMISSLATSDNSGHTATLCSAQIRQSRTSYVRHPLSENALIDSTGGNTE